MIKRKFNRKGNILTGNIVFLILNLVFISILIVFVFTKMGGAAVLEEKYSKQIALMIDSARENMVIELEMGDAFKIAEKENIALENVVVIEGNVVTVNLRDKGGYSYSFFNDLDFDGESNYYLLERESEKVGYVFTIN